MTFVCDSATDELTNRHAESNLQWGSGVRVDYRTPDSVVAREKMAGSAQSRGSRGPLRPPAGSRDSVPVGDQWAKAPEKMVVFET